MSYKKCFYSKSAKRVSIFIIAIISVVMLSGCGNRPDANGSVKAEDGRSYGGLIEEEMGKTISTVFFDLTVDSASKCTTYQFQDGLYIADEGNTYLEVDVTITNTYDKDLPMSISDFTLDFSENESEDPIIGFGSTEIGSNEYMDNIYTLKKGDSITKKILFIVADRAEYLLCYKEYYEDKFEGDSYEITMVPDELEPAVTTEASTEQTADETATEAETDDSDGSGGNEETQADTYDGTDTGIDESQDSDNNNDTDGEDTGIIEQ